ncbi:MAG TPA: SpoIIE family protein phosphatase [Streptosporangiaceae bacterium]|jgi:PAS domain S-box-containing protein
MTDHLAAADLPGLRSRTAALQQAAGLRGADPQTLLAAALTELDAAVEALGQVALNDDGNAREERAASSVHSERRLLHAVFTAAPVALYLTDTDGTVLRANRAAADLLGAGPGYATGKTLATFVDQPARAALRSQLAAASRTGSTTKLTCSMLAGGGAVRGELSIQPLNIRGDTSRLLVTVIPVSARADPAARAGQPGQPGLARPDTPKPVRARRADRPEDARVAEDAHGSDGDGDRVAASARRLDLLGAASRLLMESATVSESVLLQRCARLLSADLATWVIVDMLRRAQLRRQYVAGPDDPESARLAHVVTGLDPAPGSAPRQVAESGKSLIATYADDETLLGAGPDGVPVLPALGAASLLSVPVADTDRCYGVLTLVNSASSGQFSLADVALAEEVAALLALATTGRRTLRRRTEAAEALRASLLPPVLKPIPGIEMAAAHMTPTRGREVGGDFYDAYPTPGGWGVAIGDVCGKGDDAAAATAAARHAIRVLAHWNSEPDQVLRGANEIMLAEEFGGRFVTASAAHLRWQDGTLRMLLANAGHPGAVLVRPDGRAQMLPGGGVALGIFRDPEPTTLELDLDPGDVLFCYTDGLIGARSASGDYLEDRLSDSLAALAGRHAAEIVSEMRKLVLEFSGGTLLDDLTMFALRVGQPPGR